MESYTSVTIFGDGFDGTSTISPNNQILGTIVYSSEYVITSITTFVPSNSPLSTTTFPANQNNPTATIEYFDPQAYVYSTSYGAAVRSTSTIPANGPTSGTVIFYYPYTTTSTTALEPSNSPLTTLTYPANQGHPTATILVETPQHVVYTTSYLTSGSSSFTSTYLPSTGSMETVLVGIPGSYTTTTLYITTGALYTSTTGTGISRTVTEGVSPAPTTTTTTYVTTDPFTSTLTPVGPAETIGIGVLEHTVTTTTYLAGGEVPFTSTTDLRYRTWIQRNRVNDRNRK